jgi:prepilin-type N-terminal cleavage/methylation domain-containing protein
MKSEKGFSLIEVIIAIALLGVISAAFFGALFTVSKATFTSDELATAESLARSQLEYVKNAPYQDGGFSYEIPPDPPMTQPPPWDTTYTTLDSIYPGYSVGVNGTSLNSPDDGIQMITVIIYHNKDVDPEPVVTLEGYKIQR